MNLGRSTAFFLMLLATTGARAKAETTENPAAHDLLAHFAALNSAAMLEGAGSHGSLGLSVGAGASLPPQTPDSALARQFWGDEEDAAGLPRLWLMKGLPIPVDIAVTGTREGNGRFSQAAGMVQWTAFEALGLPALTLRASHARFFGPKAATMTSHALEAVVGVGFLRLFQVYGGVGISRHRGSFTLDDGMSEGLAMTTPSDASELSSTATFEDEWFQNVRRAGLRVMVLPPFVAMTVEAEWQKHPSYAAKLSVGM